MTDRTGLEALHARARHALAADKPAEALALYRGLLQARPSFEAYQNSAIALSRLGRMGEALALSGRLLELAPRSAFARANHAIFLAKLDRLEEALTALEETLELAPLFHDARLRQALYLLALGRYREGFSVMERRWEDPKWRRRCRHFPQPPWSGGEPLRGRRILFHSERGLGDTVQLVRYARLAAEAGASVMLEVQPPLKPLLAGLPEIVSVSAVGEKLPEFDLHCTFSSLPYLFGTTLESVPRQIPYLYPPPSQAGKWAGIIDGAGLRIGFAYRGNVGHVGGPDGRQIPLELLLHLCAGSPHRWFCLQPDATEEERALIRGFPNVVHLGGRLDDLADTAAIIAHLDLVISIDTATAHLTAALGKPLWVLATFAPSWQWRAFDDGPAWYPRVRLLKQPQPDDWEGLIAEIRTSGELGDPG